MMPGHGQQAQGGAAPLARAVFPRDRRHRRHVEQRGKLGLRAAQSETDGADLLRRDRLERRRQLYGAFPRRLPPGGEASTRATSAPASKVISGFFVLVFIGLTHTGAT